MAAFTPYHILMTVFFLFAWTRALNQFRARQMGGLVFLTWTIIWGLATYLVFLPGRADFFARLLGVESGANAVFSIAIVVLFYSIYRIYVKLEEISQTLNRHIQQTSILGERVPARRQPRKRT